MTREVQVCTSRFSVCRKTFCYPVLWVTYGPCCRFWEWPATSRIEIMEDCTILRRHACLWNRSCNTYQLNTWVCYWPYDFTRWDTTGSYFGEACREALNILQALINWLLTSCISGDLGNATHIFRVWIFRLRLPLAAYHENCFRRSRMLLLQTCLFSSN